MVFSIIKVFNREYTKEKKGLLGFRCRNIALQKVLILKDAVKEKEGKRNRKAHITPETITGYGSSSC